MIIRTFNTTYKSFSFCDDKETLANNFYVLKLKGDTSIQEDNILNRKSN